MDPTHLVTPPRAHPSGSGNEAAVDEHHRPNVIQEPWFIVLSTIILLLLCFVGVVTLVLFRRRHQITKEIGHLNGNFCFASLLCAICIFWLCFFLVFIGLPDVDQGCEHSAKQ